MKNGNYDDNPGAWRFKRYSNEAKTIEAIIGLLRGDWSNGN